MTRSILVAILLSTLSISSGYAQDYVCKNVGSSWTWFSDHFVASVKYVSVGQAGRRYEVGTGVSIAGHPLGWRETYSGQAEFSAWGMGSVHIRAADGGGPFKVCLATGDISPITIYKKEF